MKSFKGIYSATVVPVNLPVGAPAPEVRTMKLVGTLDALQEVVEFIQRSMLQYVAFDVKNAIAGWEVYHKDAMLCGESLPYPRFEFLGIFNNLVIVRGYASENPMVYRAFPPEDLRLVNPYKPATIWVNLMEDFQYRKFATEASAREHAHVYGGSSLIAIAVPVTIEKK
jgi:hypothetical protein